VFSVRYGQESNVPAGCGRCMGPAKDRTEARHFTEQYKLKQSGKGKAIPLHAMEALGGRGGIALTHSRPRH
jgi:hypothetical protein